MDNQQMSDMDKFLNLLTEIGQTFDNSQTLDGYDIECISEKCNICIEFDESKKFKRIVPMI